LLVLDARFRGHDRRIAPAACSWVAEKGPGAAHSEGIAFTQLVIPAQAGIQSIKTLLDARFRGHDR
jgi:hypothetical protein